MFYAYQTSNETSNGQFEISKKFRTNFECLFLNIDAQQKATEKTEEPQEEKQGRDKGKGETLNGPG